MDRLVEQPFPSPLGGLPVAWVLFDVRNHARIKDHLAIVLGIKATIEVDIRPFEIPSQQFAHSLQDSQALGSRTISASLTGATGRGESTNPWLSMSRSPSRPSGAYNRNGAPGASAGKFTVVGMANNISF